MESNHWKQILVVFTTLRNQRIVLQEVSNLFVNRSQEMLLSTDLSLTTDSVGAGSQALCTSSKRICVAHQREQMNRATFLES